MRLFKVNISARKVANTLLTTVLYQYLLYALLTAVIPFELDILVYSALTLRETSMVSLGSVRFFVMLDLLRLIAYAPSFILGKLFPKKHH